MLPLLLQLLLLLLSPSLVLLDSHSLDTQQRSATLIIVSVLCFQGKGKHQVSDSYWVQQRCWPGHPQTCSWCPVLIFKCLSSEINGTCHFPFKFFDVILLEYGEKLFFNFLRLFITNLIFYEGIASCLQNQKLCHPK